MDVKTPKLIDRGGPVYVEGKIAFRNGKDVCPYPTSDPNRCTWWAGWLDARTVKNLGHIFAKYKLEYP